MKAIISNFIDQILIFIDFLAFYSWTPISIFLVVGTGFFLTTQLKFIQLRKAKTALKLLIYGTEEPKDTLTHALSEDLKDVIEPKTTKLSGFQALATVLSGTIGTGNIAGVATAIVVGGPGSLFWMWMTAFFGMGTKFASCTLAHYYRQKDESGNILGGPMITLSNGLGLHKLAKVFAVFMILGCLSTGSMVQANSITDSVGYLIPSLAQNRAMIGTCISLLAAVVILGGVQRIANVASVIVPFMAIAYISTALSILLIHASEIPTIFTMIFQYAFSIKAVTGASFWFVIRSGVARGLFASEAGLGTAPIALANLDTKQSVKAGFIGMISPFFDTLGICTMTGLIILISGAYNPETSSLLTGAPLSQKAFALGFQCVGPTSSILAAWIVGIGLTLFAFTTILTWSYYGDRCVSYLIGNKYVLPYRLLFLFVLIVGSTMKLEVVWDIADVANIGMAAPNLIAVLLLRKKVYQLVAEYKATDN